jgi:3-hydroxyacyl-CoA dehydrogenase/enoyl-CoA hydratase/3-hydroxybutyryl-CoA epimerase
METQVTAPPSQTQTTPAPENTSEPSARILRELREDGICVLTFNRPNSSANVFDRATLLELSEHLDCLNRAPAPKGVVFTSAKSSIFIAGADLHAISESARDENLRQLIELGQNVFNKIEQLGIPTVAAIHGACLGGGYELSLACDYRIASPEKVTKIGLPETQLGILPAWGGSTRLPRLIGLPKALDIILAGKTLAARQALRLGLIDELVPKEYQIAKACKLILTRGRALRQKNWKSAVLANPLLGRALARYLHPKILRKTRGHYPAVLKALEVVTQGVGKPLAKSLELERNAILELAQTEACKNLIRIFLLQERAKKITGLPYKPLEATPQDKPIKNVAVIGAGVMGAGIAQWASARGSKVVLKDINAEQVGKGMATIAQIYKQGVKRHAMTPVEARSGMDRVSPAPSDVPLGNLDLVIEAAVEKMDLKKQIFRNLDAQVAPDAILATNTSALSVTELAQSTSHPERVLGIHFFNPVHRMQLVEVIVTPITSAEAVRRSVKYVQQIGKLPVVVKDSPGFLVNRILMPYLIEAGHLFESGARIEDIDEAMLEFGMPMGPLRLIDEVGVDVAYHVAQTLASHYQARMSLPGVLAKMLEKGWLGRKSGQGFYLHDKKTKEGQINPLIDKLHEGTSCAGVPRDELRTRMVLLMVNEAARCLQEEIVMDAADVDFGMIMGTGFAPFLGGPLRFADYLGLTAVTEEMKRLAARGQTRFEPCGILLSLAAEGKSFYPTKKN